MQVSVLYDCYTHGLDYVCISGVQVYCQQKFMWAPAPSAENPKLLKVPNFNPEVVRI